MPPKFQFRIADLMCATLIVGAFPLILTNDKTGRIVLFVAAIIVEIFAAPWASKILASWHIKHFLATVAIHTYAFIAVLELIFCIPRLIFFLMLVFGRFEVSYDDMRDNGFGLLVAALFTMSVFIVERKRRGLPDPG